MTALRPWRSAATTGGVCAQSRRREPGESTLLRMDARPMRSESVKGPRQRRRNVDHRDEPLRRARDRRFLVTHGP